MSYTISAAEPISLTLNQDDPIEAVKQNVAIILKTHRGTCPMYRDFGIPMDFIDRPVNVAKVLMLSEIREAVERFEPRANVTNITFSTDATDPSILIPTVEVEITL